MRSRRWWPARGLRLTRRSFVLGSAATLGAAAVAVTRPGTTQHTAAPLEPVIHRYPRTSGPGWNLAGSLAADETGYAAPLRLVGDLSAFTRMAATALDITTGLRRDSLGAIVFDVTLLMNDMTRYATNPVTAHELLLVRGPDPQYRLDFPHVHLVDTATLPGTVKHLRYPIQLQMVATARHETEVATTVLGADLDPHPARIDMTGNRWTIQYWGSHLTPSLHP